MILPAHRLLGAALLAASMPLFHGAWAADAASGEVGLEQIMADPDWIGAPVEDAYWAADGAAVYYSAKRAGTPLIDLHRIELGSGRDAVLEAGQADADGPWVLDAAGNRAAFARHGDIFVRDLASGRLRQITRTAQVETDPQFSPDGRSLSFRAGTDWYVFDFASGVTAQAAVLKTEKDPDAEPPADDLRDLQLRTFSTLQKAREDERAKRRAARDLQRVDASRPVLPFYLGDGVVVRGTALSPDARWLLVVTEPKPTGKAVQGKLTRYVTDSGYEEFEPERARVGRDPPPPQSLLLLNLVDHGVHPLSTEALPGIGDDPLAAVRAENAARRLHPSGPRGETPEPAAPKQRGVQVVRGERVIETGVRWSPDAAAVAVELRALDHKDRWIATVDLGRFALVPQHRLSDPAWVNWDFNEFGWLRAGHTLWYQSEESGFAHLYLKPVDGAARALTEGRFEVSKPQLSHDGRWFYVLANRRAPFEYDVYRVPAGGGGLAQVTRLGGVERFALDRRGRRLLVTHSSPYLPPQLAVASADGTGPVRELTDTRTPRYRALSWIAPEIVTLPSTHVDGVIYAKVYRLPGAPAGDSRPAVMFIHGAGYTQNVYLRYPYYFREQMFHNLLARRGYVVIDLDYRASAGYGRDWRTAIYRQMGHPELEDLLDAKRWLVEHAAVDPRRVGVYGGSYGGFMTLMALFRAPEEFAAGAALRPVTDWTQYNQGYTSAILNEPQVDPIAYERSSPIEFAAGLRDPLLICHGVIDDNVLFEDSMRLNQRLIELHKDRFSLAPYPLDRHGFANADSWLDEYKRVYALFVANLEK